MFLYLPFFYTKPNLEFYQSEHLETFTDCRSDISLSFRTRMVKSINNNYFCTFLNEKWMFRIPSLQQKITCEILPTCWYDDDCTFLQSYASTLTLSTLTFLSINYLLCFSFIFSLLQRKLLLTFENVTKFF